ncbi:MAG: IMP dehydrogenase, partial [Muribaculaceae bacterium]|nr:IMP dehydrogenase [Muribaculaceae bacterium]
MSFIDERIKEEGLTFDDVLLIPAYSEVTPNMVKLGSRFSRNIPLNIPMVSAAMDTVTESALAIAMAREGGIGVIHKNMSIAEQAAQVRKVKRAESGMIYDPVTITGNETVGDALRLMHDNHIGGIPVVDDDNKLVGIVTNRDLRFQTDMEIKISDVMTKENLVTTNNPNLEEAAQILLRHKIEKLPVVDADNKLVGLITYRDITKIQDYPNACKDDKGRLRVAAGVGVTSDTIQRVDALVEAGVDAVVIDTAHGHSANVVNTLKAVKEKYPNLDVVVGNIATAEAAEYLIKAGADGIKVGIGPGSI